MDCRFWKPLECIRFRLTGRINRAARGLRLAGLLVGAAMMTGPGCETTPEPEIVHTLAGNYTLPRKSILRFYEHDRQDLRNIPYEGYVVLLGDSVYDRPDLVDLRAIEVYPDESKVDLAKTLASRISMQEGVGKVNHLGETTVHVIFYQLDDGSRVALVYGRPAPGSPGALRGGGDVLIVAHY